MSSKTRGKLLLALEQDKSYESPQCSPITPTNKTSFMRKKLDNAYSQDCELVSADILQNIRIKSKVKALLDLDEEVCYKKISENVNAGKQTTKMFI
jgi:hypothetical protein